MYFVYVIPKRGSAYHGPSREMCQGWKRLRDACAAAEEISEDDSVQAANVFRCSDILSEEHCCAYINGKRQKP